VSEEPKSPPVLKRVGTFTGASGEETRVTPEAAIAAGLPLQGTLEEASPLRLCYLVAANQANGKLELDGPSAAYALFFKRGVLEHVQSSDPEDDLSHFLLKKGLVTPEQLADAAEAREGFGGDLFAALAGLRIIDPARSFPVLQEFGAGLASCTLAVERGRYRWVPGAAPPPSGFPLVHRWALVCDAVRRLDGLTLRRRLAPRMAQAPTRTGGRVDLSDLKLTAQEARLAGMLDGGRPLAELADAAGTEADALLRVTLVLLETDLVVFVEPREGARAPPAAAAPPPARAAPEPGATPAAKAAPDARGAPAAGTAPARPAPQRPAAAPAAPPARPAPAKAPAASAAPAAPAPKTDLASLRAAYERMAEADHFEVLGVAQSATAAQVKAAYFTLAKAWHPDSAAPDDPAEAKKLRADLFARISEAWGVLGEEASRKQYLEDLKTGATTPVDVAAIIEAESTFQKATVLVKTRQYEAARAALDQAIELNKDEPEFQVWRAWVDFLLAADRKKQLPASSAEIEAALKKVPRCLPAYLFLGLMAKIVGDLALAERHFKRGLQLEPSDPDLVRELRYLRK
jgi:tetratricopeptide (TPR) repeat protein